MADGHDFRCLHQVDVGRLLRCRQEQLDPSTAEHDIGQCRLSACCLGLWSFDFADPGGHSSPQRNYNSLIISSVRQMPSVLWRCWLGGRNGIWPVKTEWLGAGVVICLERGADLHMSQLMPMPLTVSCFSKIQIGFLVLAHPGSPGQRAVKWVCVVETI